MHSLFEMSRFDKIQQAEGGLEISVKKQSLEVSCNSLSFSAVSNMFYGHI